VMKRAGWAWVAGVVAWGLSGCGGGSSGNAGVFVNSMTATPTAYSRTMVVTVNGSGLDKGLQVKVDSGCGAVTEFPGGDSQTRRFTCKVEAVGGLVVRALNGANTELAKLSTTVPTPEVTLTITPDGGTAETVVLELDPVKAPLSVNNFLDYVNAGFYRNVIFHRVIKDFVIQAGGFTAGPTQKAPTRAAIALESQNGLSNVQGTLAMARTNDPNSATSQFYINTGDNSSTLDYKSESQPGYAVFGKVISGMEAVMRINAVETGVAGGMSDVPKVNQVIVTATQSK